MTRDSHEIMTLRVAYWKLRTWYAQLAFVITDRTRHMHGEAPNVRESLLVQQKLDEGRLSLVVHKIAEVETFADDCGVTL